MIGICTGAIPPAKLTVPDRLLPPLLPARLAVGPAGEAPAVGGCGGMVGICTGAGPQLLPAGLAVAPAAEAPVPPPLLLLRPADVWLLFCSTSAALDARADPWPELLPAATAVLLLLWRAARVSASTADPASTAASRGHTVGFCTAVKLPDSSIDAKGLLLLPCTAKGDAAAAAAAANGDNLMGERLNGEEPPCSTT